MVIPPFHQMLRAAAARSRRDRAMRRALPLSLVLTGLAWPVTAQTASQAEDYLGYVSHVEGSWVIAGDRVFPYRAIHRGDSLGVDLSGIGTPALAIVLVSGERIRFLCDVPIACARPLIPEDSVRADGLLDDVSRVARAVLALVQDGKGQAVHTISRGGQWREDGVASISPQGLDFSQVLGSRPPGRYRIAARAVRDDGTIDPAVVFGTTVERTGDGWAHAAVPKATSGLYRLELTEIGGPPAPIATPWVLVVGTPRFPDVAQAFAAAVSIAERWPDASETEVRGFLRAYLLHLAEEEAHGGA
jgi:hypothetical protein